ncbi:MAG: tripartite tricarboxylate transporter substrate binding protein [Rhizobiales bacterium]|nr:tripartite tricarboxylate transporter substrate binding protein [Hyphomicrobiales bacterium]
MVPLIRIALAAALAVATTAASAQTYPDQPIRMIVPFTAGSPNDVVARLLAQQLTTRLGQNVIIDNRPGAGTTTGTKAAASAEPNGYTLLFTSSSMVVSPAMYKNAGYDPEKNFVPVANAVFGHWVTVIEKSIPAKTVPEFIAYARKNPGKLAFGFGQGTAPQLVGEWLKVREKVDITSVPYKGGARAIIDMIGGRIHLNIGTTATIVPHIKAGSVKAISVWSPTRYRALPDTPTMIESGYPGLALGYWAGLWAPAGTPKAIVKKLNAAVNDSLASPEMKAALDKLGLEPVIQTPEEFGKFVHDEIPRWADIVKVSGVKGD